MSEAKMDKIVKLGEKGKVSKLIGYAGSKDPQERIAAAAALGKNDEDDAYNTLISMLRDPDLQVRISAIEGLKTMGRKSAAEHIRHTYSPNDDPAMIKAATDALGALSSHGA